MPPDPWPVGGAAVVTTPATRANPSTIVRMNVANSIDGSDGSVLGLLTTVPVGHVTTVPRESHYTKGGMYEGPLHVALDLSDSITTVRRVVAVRPGPSRHNLNLVMTPTGDIGLSVSGGSPVVSLTVIYIEPSVTTTGGSHATEATSDTT